MPSAIKSLKALPAIAVLVCLPSALLAQSVSNDEQKSHLGFAATFGLPSDFDDRFGVLLDAERTDIRSRDIEVGVIVRGRQLGGDWGLSYVQKRFNDGSLIDDTHTRFTQAGDILCGSTIMFRDVELRGFSLHKFAPFLTIKRRAQVGLTVGGGMGQVRGQALRRNFFAQSVQAGNTFGFVQRESLTETDAKDLFLEGRDWIPIWKAEITASVMLAPGLKAKLGGGLNFTNYPAFSVGLLYLLGSQ